MSGKSARAPKATTPPRRARARTALTALLLAVLGATALTGCGGDDDGDGSASARASEFEASVSAEVKRANDAAQEQLKDVKGRGNATADVSLTGKPRADTGNLLAVVVAITNRTDETASYAVQVDFRDPDGKVVETRFVGAEDLEPGERAEPVAISRKPPEPRLTAEIAKAQRY
ncbi:hypothetical protein [Streptomyces sp. IBSBF 3352]|uniref:hypothetical protein n=1 Tax=Streptomyces sp. IBSBF 3352 TaxID=2903523 RepID=UPI002FDC33F9